MITEVMSMSVIALEAAGILCMPPCLLAGRGWGGMGGAVDEMQIKV